MFLACQARLHTTERRNHMDCTLCPKMLETRRLPVESHGAEDADVLVVTIAPTRNDNRTGKLLDSRAGLWLDNLLEKHAGIDLSTVRYTSLVKCWPGSPRGGTKPDRKPNKKERTTCLTEWLVPEILACRPRLIIALGEPVLASLKPTEKLSQVHGMQLSLSVGDFDTTVIGMYHPSAISHDPKLMPVLIEDFIKLKEGRAKPTWSVSTGWAEPQAVMAFDFETTTHEVAGNFHPLVNRPIGVATAGWTEQGSGGCVRAAVVAHCSWQAGGAL